jgi:hypothetical protein
MDPLPFLFLALITFGSGQFGAWLVYRHTRPKPPITGLGQVKTKDFVAEPIPKKRKK